MAKITPGSTIIGKSGKKLIVDRVEGDIIYSGDLKILSTAVVRVIPPATRFKLGDRVKYIGGDDFDLPEGEILTVVEDCGEWVKTRTSSKKPIDIPRSILEIV
ncbi:MAG: hypothetical protein RLZZ135_2631 [Cyanobacteriota bacterium]|jgi:hypothetical protein